MAGLGRLILSRCECMVILCKRCNNHAMIVSGCDLGNRGKSRYSAEPAAISPSLSFLFWFGHFG
jgi:hypothetical protein